MRRVNLPAFQLSLRAAAAGALAFWIATLLGAHYAIYALVAAVIVSDLKPAASRRLALQRMAGTAIGALAGALFSDVIPRGPIAIGVALMVSMLCAFACRFEASAARVAGYVTAITMYAHGEEVWMYAFDRAWETMLGIAAALVVGLVPLWLRDRTEDQAPK